MSSPVCPDCGLFDIEEFVEEKKVFHRCTFCGWKGDPQPYEDRPPEVEEMLAKEHDKKRQARKEDKLFFIRVFISKDKFNPTPDLLILSTTLRDCLSCRNPPERILFKALSPE